MLNVHVDGLHNYRVGGGPHCVCATSVRVITLGMSTSRTLCSGVTISWTLGGDKHSSNVSALRILQDRSAEWPAPHPF